MSRRGRERAPRPAGQARGRPRSRRQAARDSTRRDRCPGRSRSQREQDAFEQIRDGRRVAARRPRPTPRPARSTTGLEWSPPASAPTTRSPSGSTSSATPAPPPPPTCEPARRQRPRRPRRGMATGPPSAARPSSGPDTTPSRRSPTARPASMKPAGAAGDATTMKPSPRAKAKVAFAEQRLEQAVTAERDLRDELGCPRRSPAAAQAGDHRQRTAAQRARDHPRPARRRAGPHPPRAGPRPRRRTRRPTWSSGSGRRRAQPPAGPCGAITPYAIEAALDRNDGVSPPSDRMEPTDDRARQEIASRRPATRSQADSHPTRPSGPSSPTRPLVSERPHTATWQPRERKASGCHHFFRRLGAPA